MKKLALLFCSALLFTACKPQQTGPQTQEQAMKEFEEMGKAIAEGKAVRCVMTKKDGSGEATYAVKGKKFKMTGLAEGENGSKLSMLMDEQYSYMWDDQKKEGQKYKIVIPSPLPNVTPPAAMNNQDIPDFSDPETRQDFEDQGYNVDCQTTNLQDSDFTPPADVTFQDMSQMMENANKMMQKSMNDVPVDQKEQAKEFEEMMKQYKAQ